jgi:hypothetical protein
MTEETAQYDAFAVDYDWVFSDPEPINAQRLEQAEPILQSLPRGATVPDRATDMGLLASAGFGEIKKDCAEDEEGYRVTAPAV